MNARLTRTEGFTLTEMLVSLVVLGITAGIMSTTMGTAFTSYERLNSVSGDLTTQRHLAHVMNEVSGQFWLQDGKTEEQSVIELEITSSHFQKLSIAQDQSQQWVLYAHAKGYGDTIILKSETELRFLISGTLQKNPNVRSRPYDYHMIQLQEQNIGWETIISAPLKIDENPSCRFDVVGRRCR